MLPQASASIIKFLSGCIFKMSETFVALIVNVVATAKVELMRAAVVAFLSLRH